MSTLEETLLFQIRAAKLPQPERELRFHPQRRWRFDLAWPEHKLGVEVEGGIWTQGRHVRGQGFAADCAKLNAAVLLGWRVLRFYARDDPQWGGAEHPGNCPAGSPCATLTDVIT